MLHQSKIKRPNNPGFTLLELMVALVLVSMVTLIIGIALKLTIESWERGKKEGENVQIRLAIITLISKQFDSLMKISPYTSTTKKRVLPFYGEEHGFSFFTSYAPQGSPWQGVLKVTYIYNEAEETLYLYQQVITRRENLNEEFNPITDEWSNSFSPVSKVPGITGFDLVYTGKKVRDLNDESQWEETWEPRRGTLPTGLGVKIKMGSDSKALTQSYYFRLGEG